MKKGIFITIEGGEGAGKSTLIEQLSNTMLQRGKSVTTTREPGGIPIAEQIRAVILDREQYQRWMQERKRCFMRLPEDSI